MYEEFFGLNEKPFSIQPDPSFLYWARGHRLAYAMLEYGVLNHAGISVITGEVGCGKTTLIHRLLDQLSDTHTVSLLSNIQAGRGDLLSWVLMGFGQPFADKSHVEMFSQLQSFFIGEYAKGKRIVLIIDEAQNLSMDMLEELRMLSNINAGKDQLLQLILVGQPQLKDLLNRPEMLQLAQRVGSDFHLTPLNHQEVQAYLDTRLTIAGCRRRVFTDRAIDLIAEQSRGVPRVINIIADTALVYAFSAGDLVVGVETIRNVIHDKVDYGVFGLPAEKDDALPKLPESRKGPDAFVAPETDHEEEPVEEIAVEKDEPSSGVFKPAPPIEHEVEEQEQEQEETLPQGDPVGESGPSPREQTQTIRLADLNATTTIEAASPVQLDKTKTSQSPAEASAETGVVVVGEDPKVSPEAAVRSCGDGRAVVFVASGYAPEAVAVARRAGAVIAEEGSNGFSTSGRARNAGYRQLKKIAPHMRYVQFVNAKSALDPDWLTAAEGFMARRPEVAAIEGPSRHPLANLPPFPTLGEMKTQEVEGEIQSIEDSAMMRADKFEAVGGFRGDLATAETRDLCVRLRRRGSHIWRLGVPMTLAEPQNASFNHWWRARKKFGFENAYCASLHGGPPERLGVKETARATFWGLLAPAAILSAALVSALGASFLNVVTPPMTIFAGVLAAGIAIYALKIVAGALSRGIFNLASWRQAFFAVFGTAPAFLGAAKFWFGKEKPSRGG